MQNNRSLSVLAWVLVFTMSSLIYWVASSEWANFKRADSAGHAVHHLRLALLAAEMVSKERGPTNGILGANVPLDHARVKALNEARIRTDNAFRDLQNELESDFARTMYPDLAERVNYARQALVQARNSVDRVSGYAKAERSSDLIRQTVAGMVALVPMLAPTISSISSTAQRAHPELSDAVSGARLSAELREYAGLMGSLFTPALVRQSPFTPQEKSSIDQVQGRIDQLRFLLSLQVQNSRQPPDVLAAQSVMNEKYFSWAAALVSSVIAAGTSDGKFGMDTAEFAKRYVPDMNSILGLRDAMLDDAQQRAQKSRHRALVVLGCVSAVSLLLVSILAATAWTVYRHLLDPLSMLPPELKKPPPDTLPSSAQDLAVAHSLQKTTAPSD